MFKFCSPIVETVGMTYLRESSFVEAVVVALASALLLSVSVAPVASAAPKSSTDTKPSTDTTVTTDTKTAGGGRKIG